MSFAERSRYYCTFAITACHIVTEQMPFIFLSFCLFFLKFKVKFIGIYGIQSPPSPPSRNYIYYCTFIVTACHIVTEQMPFIFSPFCLFFFKFKAKFIGIYGIQSPPPPQVNLAKCKTFKSKKYPSTHKVSPK